MPMLMTGGNKKGPQAKKIELVDQICDQGQLMQVSFPPLLQHIASGRSLSCPVVRVRAVWCI